LQQFKEGAEEKMASASKHFQDALVEVQVRQRPQMNAHSWHSILSLSLFIDCQDAELQAAGCTNNTVVHDVHLKMPRCHVLSNPYFVHAASRNSSVPSGP
jgi:hypothetical protein